jgi:hypothetical protein
MASRRATQMASLQYEDFSAGQPMVEAASHRIRITHAIDHIKNVYLKRGGAVLIRGGSGIGKSSRLVSLAKELQDSNANYGATYYNWANATAPDVQGWPRPGAGPLSTTAMPALFQPVPHLGLRGGFPAALDPGLLNKGTTNKLYQLLGMEPYPNCISINDEIGNVSSEDVFAIANMLALEGRTGAWGLPPNSLRIFITNRADEHHSVLTPPGTFFSRVATLDVYATFADAEPHWTSIGMHPWWISFAEQMPDLAMADKPPEVAGPYGNIRSWTEAWEDIKVFLRDEIGIPQDEAHENDTNYWPEEESVCGLLNPRASDDEQIHYLARMFMVTIAARCGARAAGAFVDFVAHISERPTYAQIVADPMRAPMPRHHGVLYWTVRMLVKTINIKDMYEVVEYLSRSEVPSALRAVWANKMVECNPLGLARNKVFMEFVNNCGDAARISLRS